MQVKFIAMAIAAMAATPAFAQTNVKIYGSLDALVETFSNDGAATSMDDATHKTSRLGFQGEEDLGGGLKAFFQLEERFQLDTATADDALRFKDKAWVGLSGGFGSVSFGRVPTALDIIYGGGKAANVDTIADVSQRKSRAQGRVDNGISYSSPKLGPVVIHAHTALNERADAVPDYVPALTANGALPAAPTPAQTATQGYQQGPVPYGVAASATFGAFFVEAGWQKDGVLAANMYKTWLVNGGVKFGQSNLYFAASQSKGYQSAGIGVDPDIKRTRAALGFDTSLSANGKLYATLTNGKEVNAAGVTNRKFNKVGVAYVHSLSKRTQLIGAGSYESAKDQNGNGVFGGGSKSQIGLQAGLRHAF